jgi:hypothetical protein
MILTGYFSLLIPNDLIMAAYLVLAEAVLIGVWGFPDFPEGLYGIFASCCFLSCRFSASVPTSWVPSFAHIWSASKAAYGRVRGAGNNAWVYVLGIGREV